MLKLDTLRTKIGPAEPDGRCKVFWLIQTPMYNLRWKHAGWLMPEVTKSPSTKLPSAVDDFRLKRQEQVTRELALRLDNQVLKGMRNGRL